MDEPSASPSLTSVHSHHKSSNNHVEDHNDATMKEKIFESSHTSNSNNHSSLSSSPYPSLIIKGRRLSSDPLPPPTTASSTTYSSSSNSVSASFGTNGLLPAVDGMSISSSPSSSNGTTLHAPANGNPSTSNGKPAQQEVLTLPPSMLLKSGSNGAVNGYDSPTIFKSSSSSAIPVPEKKPNLSSSSGGMKKKMGIEDFEMGEVIGEGSFGEVKLAEERATKIMYAAKILSKQQLKKENKAKYALTEKTILENLRHPNIVRLYATFQTPNELYFIMELCPKGELLHLIKQAGAFEEHVAKFYGAEVLSAIAYIHSQGYAHRDVKPENVLLNPTMHAKLSDFGSAKQIPLRGRSASFVGTAEYVCPELLTQRSAGHAADMWSYGVMMVHMLTGSLPFKGINEFQVFQEIQKGEYAIPDYLSAAAKDLISKLLVSDPDNRVDAATAKKHEFFAGVDWDALEFTTPPTITVKAASPQQSPPQRIEEEEPETVLTVTPPVEHPAIQKKSPKLLRFMRGEKRNSSPAIAIHLPPSGQSPTLSHSHSHSLTHSNSHSLTHSNSHSHSHHSHSPMVHVSSSSSHHASSPPTHSVPSSPLSRTSSTHTPPATPPSHSLSPFQHSRSTRAPLNPSMSSPQLTFLNDGKLQPPRSRERASSEFNNPPKFLEKPSDHSRWATFLTPNERIMFTGIVQLRKKVFFARQRLFLIVTEHRLALVDPTTWKPLHEYMWGSQIVSAAFKDTKSFTLTTGSKVRHFDDIVGNTQQLVDMIMYLSGKAAKV